MTQDTIFTDEQLTAYLDGEADVNLRDTIDAAMGNDHALVKRLNDLDIDTSAITAAFDDLLAQSPPMQDVKDSPLAAPLPANTNAKPGLFGGLALFGTGIAAGIAMMLFWGTTPPEPKAPGWKAVVASYQSLYSNDTLTGGTLTPTETAHQLAKVSTAIGADLSNLPDVQGLDFRRAQILGFNGKPLIQIAFARDDGTPIALCIIPAKSKNAKAMASETIQGMAAASWNRDGLAYLLIGGDEAALTAQEAQAFEVWANSVTEI